MFRLIISILILCCIGKSNFAQEKVVPLKYNPSLVLSEAETKPSAKKKRASLPFIDDFSYTGPYPDASRWKDRQAYINNTMSTQHPTAGMATLDGLNQYGRPYFPNQFSSGFADSLTSVEIDLSAYTIASNIFFSFYFQPQGLSFAPETDDSLFLYFKNSSNQWVRMWQTWGTPNYPFKTVFIPVNQSQFLHAQFQFRFVNLASLNLNNDIWNLDYIKLDANRSASDSILNDVAFTIPPTSILYPYSAMPYRHFMANQAGEKSALQAFQVRNNSTIAQNVSTSHSAIELFSSSAISNSVLPTINVGANSSQNQSVNSYNISYTPPNSQAPVTIRNTYFFTGISATDKKENDTIYNDVVFDNYFAYDDGSAEKAYFLYSALNTPAKTALEFRLNEPDTIRGIGAFFAAQAPTALGKYFSVVLYKQLAGNGLNDSIIHQEDLYQVQYDTAINGFTYYGFNTPKVLSPGTYYMGITQPANFGSDSIYYGLDVNNNTSSQHLYYNVDGTWYASTVNGSVMIRPMVGRHFTSTAIGEIIKPKESIILFPNPSTDLLYLQSKTKIVSCTLYQLNGAKLGQHDVIDNKISVVNYPPGIYILEAIDEHKNSYTQTFYKK